MAQPARAEMSTSGAGDVQLSAPLLGCLSGGPALNLREASRSKGNDGSAHGCSALKGAGRADCPVCLMDDRTLVG